MNANAQIIEQDGKPAFAVLPYAEYESLLARLEDSADARALAEVDAELASGDEELLPADAAERIANGEPPLLVYRELRGFTQQQLATAADVSKEYVSLIESGKRAGSAAVLAAFASKLGVHVEDLLA